MSNSGGLLQLVATGRQDIYLSGNPQTTFFKQVYRRYTNFSMETQRIPFDTAVDFGKLHTVNIPRNGDLLSQLYLEISLPYVDSDGPHSSVPNSGGPNCTTTQPPTDYNTIPTNAVSWVNGIGYAMIDYISIWIGQQEVDRQYGEYMYLWTQLTTPGSKHEGINFMIGNQQVYDETTQPGPLKLYVPLHFWFCRDIGLSLPLIALQATPVKIYIKLRGANEVVFSNQLEQAVLNGTACPPSVMATPATITEMTLWGDYIYLDTEERRRFVSSKHEYLITQVQQQKRYSIPEKAKTATVDLNFNHPLREMIWVVSQDRMVNAHEFFNYGSRMLKEFGIPNLDLIASALFQFDGYDRFEEQSAQYFRLVQPWMRHTAIPNDFIYSYSFSLAPEAAQPQGACNASRIDTITLQLTMNPQVKSYSSGVTVYAVNYNVLRIVAGLGGVLFTV
jgi:Major capsid protein N-terminus/Large eukaryotic DNA virus major capsid protein